MRRSVPGEGGGGVLVLDVLPAEHLDVVAVPACAPMDLELNVVVAVDAQVLDHGPRTAVRKVVDGPTQDEIPLPVPTEARVLHPVPLTRDAHRLARCVDEF